MVHEGNRPDLDLKIRAVEPMQRIANWGSDRDDAVIVCELYLDALEVRWIKDRVDRHADDLRARGCSREPDGRRVGENYPFTVVDENAIGSQLDELFQAVASSPAMTAPGQNHPSSVGEPIVRGSAEYRVPLRLR